MSGNLERPATHRSLPIVAAGNLIPAARDKAVDKVFARARWMALLASAGVAAGLAMKVHWRNLTVLELFWQGIIPLVPLLLLVAPHFWRSICPVAALNLLGDRLARRDHSSRLARLPGGASRWIKRHGVALATVLFWILAPLRLLLLNDSAGATLSLILAMVAVAVVMGIAMPWKAGWCSSLCPVYPVEKFYGLAPLWTLRDRRCFAGNSPDNCPRCALNCLDVPLSEGKYWKAMAAAPSNWFCSSLRNFFRGSFPGLVLAYWLLLNFGNLSRPAMLGTVVVVYATFLLLMLASYGLYRVAQAGLAGRQAEGARALWSRRVDLVLVFLAVNIYYLIGGVGLAEVLSKLAGWAAEPFPLSLAIGGAALLVSTFWLYRAWCSPVPAWSR